MDIPLLAELDPALQRQQDRQRFLRAALISGGFVALLWWIKAFELWTGVSFRGLGVVPLSPLGLVGVVTAPLLHGSVPHLIANTLPLLLLGVLAVATLPRAAPRAVALIWVLSGLAVWVFGRPPVHVGASGISHGLLFFLLLAGILRRDRIGIASACAAFFLYGGMLMTVLPREAQVSWEYHLGGAVAGVLAAALWSRRDPLPARKRYSWELDENPNDPAIDQVLEPPSPMTVPVLWNREDVPKTGVILPFLSRHPRAEGEEKG